MKLKSKKYFLVIIFFVGFFGSVISQQEKTLEEKLQDSVHYNCYNVMQIISYSNKVDTVYTKQCDEKKLILYIKGKEYIYNSKILDSKGKVVSKSKVKFKGSNEVRLEDRKQNLITMYFERNKNDSILLQPLVNNQTYSLWLDSMKQGVIETKDRVWIHPIQANGFLQTEIAAFPEAILPLYLGKIWNSTLNIFEWGDWSGQKRVNTYQVKSKKKFKIKKEKIICWEIEGISEYENEKNKLTYLFNEQYGFVSMKYEFTNGTKINFEMIDAISK